MMTRRESMAALAALAQPTGYFDAHVHVWSADTKKYPLAPGFHLRDIEPRSFSAEQLRKHTDAAGVSRVNLVQMTWYGLDHRYILDLIAREPQRYRGTGIVPAISDVDGPPIEETMVELSKGGILAFRVRGKSTRPPMPEMAQWMEHPGYEKLFAAGAKHNLALSFLMSPSDLPELDRMCTRFPETPVIIDHFCRIGAGGRIPEEELAALTRMARHKRVMVKIGAFYAFGKKQAPYVDLLPMIRAVVAAFGANRCMWESDAPYQVAAPHTYKASVALIPKHADFLSAAEKHQIMTKTADDFFFRR